MSRRVPTPVVLLLLTAIVPAAGAQAQAWSRTFTADQHARTERLIGIANGMLTITEVATRSDRRQTRTVKRARVADLDADATTVEVGGGILVRGGTNVWVRCRFATRCWSRTGGRAEERIMVPFSDERVARQFHADLTRAARNAAPRRPPVVADRRAWGRQVILDPTLFGPQNVEQHLGLEGNRLVVYQRTSKPWRSADGITSSLSRVPVRSIDWRTTHVEVKENGVLGATLGMNPPSSPATVYMADFATFRQFRGDMLAAAGVNARGILCVDPDSVVRGVPSLGRVVFDRSSVSPSEARRYATPALQAPVRARIEAALQGATRRARVPYAATWFTDESFCPGLTDATDVAIQVLSSSGAAQPAQPAPAEPGRRTTGGTLARLATVRIQCDSSCAVQVAGRAPMRLAAGMPRALQLPAGAVEIAVRAPQGGEANRYYIALAPGRDTLLTLQAPWSVPSPRIPSRLADSLYVAARSAYARRSYGTAARPALRAAEMGHTAAQDLVGRMYRNGQGLPRSAPNALRWWRRAGASGHADAAMTLAGVYTVGWDVAGIEQDPQLALYWTRMAAESGDGARQQRLAVMYQEGSIGARSDSVMALVWYRRAADNGATSAAFKVGEYFAAGRVVPRDRTMAEKYFRLALGSRFYRPQAEAELRRLGVTP